MKGEKIRAKIEIRTKKKVKEKEWGIERKI